MPRASAIAALTALGAAQNALVPLASAAQFALCGHAGAGASAIAAYGLALASTNVATSAFNFVSDGVVAKVGAYLARKDVARAAAAARLAVACALGAGAASCAILFALRDALFDKTFAKQTKDTTAMALEVFVCRAACAPLVCAIAALRGVLGGCGRVGAATMLSALGAALETAVVASATSARLNLDGAAMMRWIGVGYVIVVIVQFLVSACVVATLPPRGASEPLDVWRARMLLPRKDAFDFMSDGASMVVRSTLLQASFFIAVVIASRSFDASGLAAHHIICQLWLIASYVVDGLATCANVLGARLYRTDMREFKSLLYILLALGVSAGVMFSAILVWGKTFIPTVFTADAAAREALATSGVWTILVAAQPINAAVFVYDGFIYASHSFSYVRQVMIAGVGLVFLPTLYLANRPTATLRGIWTAKLALNAWRLVCLVARVHFWVLETPEYDDDDDVSSEFESESSQSLDAFAATPRDAYYEPLLDAASDDEDEDEDEDEKETRESNVQYESSLKPSKIKSGYSPIRTPEISLAMSRASSTRR
jgi:Na+-driven multidrug efflux pump